jgi:hypothetical protein
MPDIMMCDAHECPASKTCRRHPDSGTKPDPYRQSWWLRSDSADPGGNAPINSPVYPNCPNHWGMCDG